MPFWPAMLHKSVMGYLGISLFQWFGLTTIPALVLLDRNGIGLCTNAQSRLVSDPGCVSFKWRASAHRQVGDLAVVNFDLPPAGAAASAQMLPPTTQLTLLVPPHDRPPSFCTSDPLPIQPLLPAIDRGKQPSSCGTNPEASQPPPQAVAQPFSGGGCRGVIMHMPQEGQMDLPAPLPLPGVHNRARTVRNTKQKATSDIVPLEQPPEKPNKIPQGKHTSLMQPQPLAEVHPFTPKLWEWHHGIPVDCGPN
jgi:hypothetical protein